MSASKGPWRTDGRRIVSEATSTILAETWSPTAYDPEHKEQEANARLIAAAPDLIEACKHALTIVNEYDETSFAGTIVLRRMLEASIAKAEGR